MPWTGTTEIIAERHLTLATEAGNVGPVWVRIGKPARTPGHEDFYCEFQVEGLGGDKIHKICGVDAFQSLQLAQRCLVTMLNDYREKHHGRLYLDEPGDDMGFPNGMGFTEQKPIKRR